MKQRTPIITVRNLSVGYDTDLILRDVTFDVYAGEILAILGRSGCGKSTLFKAMVGLLEPLEGSITMDGEPVIPHSAGGTEQLLQKIGVLFQSGALFSSMTVAENVAFPLVQLTALSRTTIEEMVLMKLAQVGLAGRERMLPAELSGGMQKRAALARAMALDPSILFFDEPSAGLDPITSAELDRTILTINATLGTTVVIVTHELASIHALAHRVILLDREEKGIIAEGTVDELVQKSEDTRVQAFFNRGIRRPAGASDAVPEERSGA